MATESGTANSSSATLEIPLDISQPALPKSSAEETAGPCAKEQEDDTATEVGVLSEGDLTEGETAVLSETETLFEGPSSWPPNVLRPPRALPEVSPYESKRQQEQAERNKKRKRGGKRQQHFAEKLGRGRGSGRRGPRGGRGDSKASSV